MNIKNSLKKAFSRLSPVVIHKTQNKTIGVPAEFRRYIDINIGRTRFLLSVKPQFLKKHPALIKKEKEQKDQKSL